MIVKAVFQVLFNDLRTNAYVSFKSIASGERRQIQTALIRDSLGVRSMLQDWLPIVLDHDSMIVVVSHYRYVSSSQRIRLLIDVPDEVNPSAVRSALREFIETGPDTWMEGDILLSAHIELDLQLVSAG